MEAVTEVDDLLTSDLGDVRTEDDEPQNLGEDAEMTENEQALFAGSMDFVERIRGLDEIDPEIPLTGHETRLPKMKDETHDLDEYFGLVGKHDHEVAHDLGEGLKLKPMQVVAVRDYLTGHIKKMFNGLMEAEKEYD